MDRFNFPSDRKSLVALARVMEAAERYADMLVVMKKVGSISADFDSEERNLFAVACSSDIVS